MDFNEYYKKSSKLELRKYARKVPNLTRIYSDYWFGLDNYEKEANCTIFLYEVNYNYGQVFDEGPIDIYAPSVFDKANVFLAYNPYKNYMFEIWNNLIFLNGKQVGETPKDISNEDYSFYKDFKFYDPFMHKKKHNLASISQKSLNRYRTKLDKGLNVLIHDYVEVYHLDSDSLDGWDLREYRKFDFQRDIKKKVVGEFDNVDSLKDFLIKKNLKSKKIDENEQLIDLIEDYFVRTHIMKIENKYYIDYYDVIPSGFMYSKALEL